MKLEALDGDFFGIMKETALLFPEVDHRKYHYHKIK